MAFLSQIAASEPAFYGLLISCIVLLWLAQKLYNAFTSPIRRIPGPLYSPFTDLPLKKAVLSGQRVNHIHDLHKEYGPVVRISPEEISISDPAAVYDIHRVGSKFAKSDWYQRFVRKPVPGVFDMIDFKQHAARRKLFARAFMKTELRMRWEDMILAKAELAVQKIKADLTQGGADVAKWWFFMAADVSAHLMFGESFRLLEAGKTNDYIATLQNAAQGGAFFTELPLVASIARLIPHPKIQLIFRSNDDLTKFGRQLVAKGKAQGSDIVTIFGQMEVGDLSNPKEYANSLSELDVATEAGNLILAGTDTTGFLLTYAVWAILANPSLQSALETEVTETYPTAIKDAELESLPILNAVMNETLRLYGSAPGSLPRVVPAGGVTVAGHYIPENTVVSTQSWTLHRDEHLWPNAEKYDPYRWLPSGPSPETLRTGFAPFGAGSRICLGLHLAQMEFRIALALFFRECKGAKLAPHMSRELQFDNYFLIKPKGGKVDIVAG